jgi:hypothetical protein
MPWPPSRKPFVFAVDVIKKYRVYGLPSVSEQKIEVDETGLAAAVE